MSTKRIFPDIKSRLEAIVKNEPGTIRAAVATEALSYDPDEAYSFLLHVIDHGCESGMVSSLITYQQTHAFFDAHYEEIEDLRVEQDENIYGEHAWLQGDLKNTLAWFGFEQTAYHMLDEFGEDV